MTNSPWRKWDGVHESLATGDIAIVSTLDMVYKIMYVSLIILSDTVNDMMVSML